MSVHDDRAASCMFPWEPHANAENRVSMMERRRDLSSDQWGAEAFVNSLASKSLSEPRKSVAKSVFTGSERIEAT